MRDGEIPVSGNTYQITPFMHVIDSDTAVRFFVDIVGFTAVVRQDGYAYLDREGAGLRGRRPVCPRGTTKENGRRLWRRPCPLFQRGIALDH